LKYGRAVWIDRPWIDLLIGCGGWSVPLLLVSYTIVDRDVPTWTAVFYGLALVCNYPHYMATIYRAYGRDDRSRYRLFTHYLTAALVAVGVAAHVRFALVPWLFTAYVMWSPWHYTGQNFGLLMMFLRRAGLDVSAEERQRLHIAFIASYVMLLAAFNQRASADPLVLSMGLPVVAARIVEAGAGLVFLAAGLAAFVPIARRADRGALLAPLTLYSTQALWFVVPIALTWIAALPVPQTRYSSGMLAVMHSAQYLWITRYFAQRDAERAPRPVRWSAWAYWGTLVAGGLALFLPVPWLASYGWHADFTASMFIVAAVVNIHHFMLDGVVWKLRNPRVGQVLVGAGGASAAAVPSPVRAAASPGRRVGSLVWRVPAVVLLVALAALDQWRYLLAVGNTDRRRIEAATTLNPYDSGAYMRLAQAERRTGDAAAAEASLGRAIAANPQNPAPAQALERLLIEQERFGDAYALCQRMIARWPSDVDTLVNAGVIAYRLGDRAAAVRWWGQALEHDASLLRVHLYLAELLDARGETASALPHYQRYLELVPTTPAGDRPLPREVVAVVVKFADALARHGDKDAAIAQYDLAIRLARQTGLTDVESLAQQARAAMLK
jgi:tetratricopeptide (TPR) repeat protein